MTILRRSEERGRFDHGWLDTRHTFSFADYYDPHHLGFGPLRVINEDRIAAGAGFPTHPHRDMEIITYVLDGALAHRDSMGNGSVIRRGDVQRMSAGTGVTHSEYNHSKTDPVHLLQIWIHPERSGIEPSYEQKAFADDEKRGRLRLVASPDGADGSVVIHQDARVYATLLGPDERVVQELAVGRGAWIHVALGSVTVGGHDLGPGDAVAASEPATLEIVGAPGNEIAEVLLFDLPS